MPKTLTTTRLTLCAPLTTDAAALTCLISDWDVIRMLATPPFPYSVADARHFIATASDRPWDFAIYRGPDLIGMCGITDHLGYWLGKPYWGEGYATEAARAVLAAYWAGTSATEVVSGAFQENRMSQRILTKLGFRRTGQSSVWCAPRKVHVNHIDMALVRPDRAG